MTAWPLFNRNLMFLTALSLIWAWQLMLAAVFVFGHIPAPSDLISQVLPEWQHLLYPDWKPLVFHLTAASGLGFQLILLWFNRKDLAMKDLMRPWTAYLIVELLITFGMSSAQFKLITCAQRPVLAHQALIVFMAAAVLCKVFSDRWQDWGRFCWGLGLRLAQDPHQRRWAEWAVPAGICVLLFIPNIQAVVARNFIGEQFHHNDSFIMGPGLAYTSGQILDVDIISQYGIGFVVVISRLAKLLGGFSYEHVMTVMVMGTLLYYLAWYALVRRWLDSLLLALAVTLLGIKWQMFHTGVFPFVFTYGSQTPMRFVYDVFYFWCIWMHIQTGRKSWLWGAGAACGFGIYYLTSEGLYGTASLWAYLILLWAMPAWRRHARLRLTDAVLLLWPLAAAFFLLFATVGFHVFTRTFWGNWGEFINYFASGFGLEPMYKSLQDRKFLESLMGFVIPIVDFFTLLIILGRLAFDKARKEEWLAAVLCFYGLGTYHYYVARSVSTSYDGASFSFTLVLGFWAQTLIASLKQGQRMPVRLILALAAAWALLTTHLFLSYPNLINLSSHPLTDPKVALPLSDGRPYFNHLFRDQPQELSFNSLGGTQVEFLSESDFSSDKGLVEDYLKNSRFAKDTDMIRSLTSRGDEVPLISSFEVKMLMEAGRKPFFYYFPLLISRPMTMRSFAACSIYTTQQLEKTLRKFEDVKPAYVFLERIYMVSEVPRDYLFRFPSLVPLINYVRTHYAAVAQGEYLVALKRM